MFLEVFTGLLIFLFLSSFSFSPPFFQLDNIPQIFYFSFFITTVLFRFPFSPFCSPHSFEF